MLIVKWFFWRRWQFARWSKEEDWHKDDLLLNNLQVVNFAGCKKHPIIYEDMRKILCKRN